MSAGEGSLCYRPAGHPTTGEAWVRGAEARDADPPRTADRCRGAGRRVGDYDVMTIPSAILNSTASLMRVPPTNALVLAFRSQSCGRATRYREPDGRSECLKSRQTVILAAVTAVSRRRIFTGRSQDSGSSSARERELSTVRSAQRGRLTGSVARARPAGVRGRRRWPSLRGRRPGRLWMMRRRSRVQWCGRPGCRGSRVHRRPWRTDVHRRGRSPRGPCKPPR
jgi:hypothetical protein